MKITKIEKVLVRYYFIAASIHYLGCFIDQIGDRDLNVFIGEDEQLTPQKCLLACQEQNFPYAGIQYGSECRCDRQYGKYHRVSDDECTYVCSTSEKCGGDNRNSIYSAVNSENKYSKHFRFSEK